MRGDNDEKLKSEFAQALASAGQSGADGVAARQKKAQSLTLTAHDGENGQVTSTTGSLTFRTGDTLSGNDREQMRVTPEGRVGIGTTDPQAAQRVLDEALAAGHEGVVVKDARSPYAAGRRGKAWRKVKPVRTYDLGDPRTRDPQRVADDVLDGLITADEARRDYAVAVDGQGRVDQAETERLRRVG